ncbi:MAG: non-ribosomal peptide synthetase [Myxococcales bacterium]|nr:non-ribosomal peptide synthetase [Myxococcales bacterium]
MLDGVALCYAELNERANRLAHHLVDRGVGPEVVVGVHMERTLDLVVALLAVLKAGGAYLPLDPNYPAERLAFMLDDCRVPVLISSGPSLEVPFTGVRIDLAAEAAAIAARPSVNVAVDVDPANLAYVIYTSGSTGRPKGVLIPHDRVTRLMSATAAWFHFDEHDVWTFFHSYAFDFSVWEIWGALIYGGTVVIVSDRVRRVPDDLLELLSAERVTILNQIPSAFRNLIAAATRTSERVPLALRVVIFGGEALDFRSLVPWFERYPDGPLLVNMYGITETTVHVTYRPVDADECRIVRGSPIGVPIPDLEMYLLDDALIPVPDGDEGEIYVGGAGLARGYQRRAALTSERFVPDPFSGRSGARLYKTGDVGRRLPDGSFEHLGRNDAQVKIRGYRIETGEIAATLMAHPSVREAVIVAREIDEGDRRLVAYVVLADPVSNDALRGHVADRLPSYMVPSAFVVIDALPLAPSGKIDVKALSAPNRSDARTDYAPPQTEAEQILAALWSSLLGVPRIGRNDRFFELGGHSLLAAQVANRLGADYGVVVPVRLFLTSPTLAEAAAVLADALAKHVRDPAPAVRIPRRPQLDRSPLSLAQESIWVHDRILLDVARRARAYIECPSLEIRGPINIGLLERVLNEIGARHEIWRTSFVFEDDAVQVIGRSARIPLRLYDRSGTPAERRRTEAEAVAESLAAQPFALDRGPLLRCGLVTFDHDHHVLVMVMHHLITDAWSENLVASEIARLYGFLVDGEPLPPRNEVEVQYGDYAAWERGSNQEREREVARTFWRTAFSDLPEPLALVRPSADPTASRPLRITRVLAPVVEAKLTASCRQRNLSRSSLLYAAFATILAPSARNGRFVLGVAASNRTQASEAVLGCFSGVLPLIVDVTDQPDLETLGRRLMMRVADAVPHGIVPLNEIARLAGRGRGAPVVQVQVSTQLPRETQTCGDVTFRQDFIPISDCKFALKLIINELDDGISLTWVADPTLLGRTDLDALVAAFDATLERELGVSPSGDSEAASPAATEAPPLARLFADVLGIERVEPGDDFFTLGGHSLLAIRLITKIRTAFGVDVSLAKFLDSPTLAWVTVELARLQGRPAGPAIAAAPRDRALPASSAQERVWFVERMLRPTDPRPLNVSVAIAIRGALDPAVLARCLTEVVARHEIWRTNLRVHDRQLVQVIAPPSPIELLLADETPHAGDRERRLLELAREQARPAFDLASDRLARARLVRWASDDHVLLLVVHHAVFDGASAAVLVRELAALYPAFAAGRPSPLAPIALQYADVAHWQRQLAPTTDHDRQLAYWRDHLAGIVPLELPTDFTRPSAAAYAGARVDVVVPRTVTQTARELAARESTTLFAVVLAAFAAQLARWADQTDLVIGTGVTQRDRPELDGVIGLLLDQLALRVDVAGDPDFRELVRRSRRVVTAAFANRDVPFERIVASLDRKPDLARQPIFQVTLTMNELSRPTTEDGRTWSIAFPDPGVGILDELSLQILDDGDDLVAWIDYRTDLFAPPTIARLADELVTLLAHAIAAPDRRLSELAPIRAPISAQLDRPAAASKPQAPTPATPRDRVEEVVDAAFRDALGMPHVAADDDFFEIGGHSLLAAHAISQISEALGVDVPLRALFEYPTVDALAAHLRRGSMVHATHGPGADRRANDIAAVFGEVLGRPPVGLDDNFFELGGQNVLAASALIARLHERFAVELPLRALVEAPTPRALAAVLPAASAGAEPEAEQAIPLSFAQERLWFLHQLAPASAAYNTPLARRLRGPLDVERLRRAIERVWHRHAGLRTMFPAHDGVPRQHVIPPARFELRVGEVAGESALERAVAEEVERPFELEAAPPFRAWLVRVGPDDHALVVTMHHIVSDGRSLELVWRDICRGYAGEPIAAAVPYTKFAADQRKRQSDEVLSGQLAAWKQRLEGAPAQIELPYKPNATSSGRPREVVVELAPEVVTGLHEVARRAGTTLFVTFLAAVRALLARATGQLDLCIGAPFTNRTHKDLDEVVGCFVNTLPLRTSVELDAGFLALVRRERDTVLDAYDRQDVPLDRVIQALGIERTAGRNPLFQVTYQHLAAEGAIERLGALAAESFEPARSAAQFDLDIETWERGAALEVRLIYDDARFDRDAIASLGSQLALLVRAAVRDPEQPVSQLPVIDAFERHRLIDTWNRTSSALVAATVPELFAARVARSPGATAVVFGEATMTYRELDTRARRIAAALRGHAIGPEAIVAVALPRSFELVAALLGVLDGGAAYLPLDPTLPRARLASLAALARPRAVVTTSAHAAGLADLGVPIVVLDGLDIEPIRERVAVADTNLAYVVFTSGSTGAPKGVMVSHRALANELAASNRMLRELQPHDGFLQLAATSFDQSIHEMLWPLVSGARLVLVGDGEHRDPARLVERIRAARVTILDAVPTLLRAIVAEPGFAACTEIALIVAGGEALPPDLVAAVAAVRPGVPLFNGYGPTETAITVCYARCEPGAPVVLGPPWANVRFHVLDRDLEPVPIGVAGELYIAGDQLARGYVGRSDLTADRFVPDPFATDGTRMYRTGDRVRRNADGTLGFLGRTDDQVKIRGVRIELGEIEAALRAHASVAEAAVVATRGALVAHVVTRSAVDPDAIRTHLAARLPAYMVPPTIAVVAALPRLASGKLDRRALAQLAEAAPATRVPAKPVSRVEETILAVWREVLDLEDIGVDDDFFALGGHSLLATQVVSRVRAQLDVPLTLQHLFEAPTIAELAIEIAKLSTSAPPALAPTAVQRDSEPALSYAQQRLWLLHQIDPESSAYHMPAGRRLHGPLDREALRRAFEDVVARHEILRTAYPAPGGVPHQKVMPPGPWELPVDDLTVLVDEAARARTLDQISHDDLARPFDLARGPVLRTRLVRLAATDHVLLVTVHHIACDGWSFDVLWRELAACYAGHRRHAPVTLTPLALQYADVAAQERHASNDGTLDRELAYWTRQLADAPAEVALPRKHPPSTARRGANEEMVIALGPTLATALRELARREGASLFHALLAALRATMVRTTGQHDVVIGTPIANRDRTELEALIGLFVNTVVLRRSVAPTATYAELIRGERDTTLEAHAHQRVPFEMIVDALGVVRSPTRTPIFQVWFVQETVAAKPIPLAGELAEVPFLRGAVASKFDLSVYVNEVDDRVELAFVFDPARFERAVIDGIARRFERAVEVGVRTPDRSVDELDFGDAPAGANPRVALARPTYRPVLELVAELAAAAPDAPALRHRDRTRTRGELWGAAKRVAEALADAGIAPGDRVALIGAPSFGLYAAFLGVLHRGACLVPVSPRLAEGNARTIIETTDARLVLRVGGAVGDRLGPAAVGAIDPDTAAATLPELPAGRRHDPAHRYIYFTSGTTGAQKAVVGNLDALAHFIAWQNHTFAELAGPISAQLTELGFDVFLRDTMFALATGKLMAVPPAELTELEPSEVMRWLARERVTAIHTVPSLARAWLEACPPDVDLSALRCVFVVGEPLDSVLVGRWRDRFGATEFVNFYGTTETGPAKTWYVVPASPEPGIQPAGRSLPETQILVLRGDRVCADGEVGDVVIRTPFSTLGYLEPTDHAKFFANPFRTDPLDTCYRTGDLGRYRPDGVLELVGRADDQVKIHGQRVDPQGIAAALRAHPEVTDAAVIALRLGDEVRLAAYVVHRESRAMAAALRDYLRLTIPPYMIPASFTFVPALPRKPNGKVDRAALPVPDWDVDDYAFVPPRSSEEEAIATIWCEVLELEHVGIRDDFFARGGHSLLAVLVISRVRSLFEVELALQSFFAAPTVEAMAAEVVRLRSGPRASAPRIERLPRDGELPLSFAQQRMWFLHRLAPSSPAYHVPIERRLRGSLAVEAVRRAFETVVRRHEPLRTVFVPRAGVPVQRILDAPERWELPIDDVSALAHDAREAEVARIVREHADQPFDLAAGPLLRTRVIRIAPDDHVLLVTLHHIVSDAWSMGVLWHEIAELYRAYTSGVPARLPALAIQYADLAAWQRRQLAGERLEQQLAYWTHKLADAPAETALPIKGPRPVRPSARGGQVTFELDTDVMARIRALGKRLSATPFMILVAALRAVLARATGQDDLCIGAPIANRTEAATEHVIGLLLNTLVLRTPLDARGTFAELVRAERKTALEAYANQDAPFEMIVDALQLERVLDRTPLFQVSFVHQNLPQAAEPIGDLVDEVFTRVEPTARFDLSIVSFPRDGRLAFELIYSADLFDRWQIEQLAEHYARFVRDATRDADHAVAGIATLSEDERRDLLVRWNRAPGSAPDTTIGALFEAQVDRTPDATALVLGSERRTYHELDERANQVAHALRERGVGPEVVVGIALERSFDLVIAILAVTKAGGAWVPLDPQLPAARLDVMAETVRPVVVLASAATAGRLPFLAAPILRIGDLAGTTSTRPPRTAAGDHLAYVLFTSGSTGVPKGVMISHRGIVNELASAQALRARLGPDDAFLQLAPYTFDLSVHEILWPLTVGARLVLLPEGAHRDPRQIVEEMRARDITIMHPVPTLLRALLADPDLDRCTRLRTMVCGGEPLPLDLLRAFVARRPDVALVNSYGPTETSVTVSQWRCKPDATAVAIGSPWIDTQLYVLGGDLEPVPFGVIGELYIGGRQVGRGYIGQPALTAERFIADPFATTRGARMYRTGDRARRWPDGNVELVGRVDTQVKLRGFRIELGEIEAVLRREPGVREAVVEIAGSGADARLVAYVVAEPDWTADPARAALAARLPEYMVPKAFVRLDTLPLTRSGKVDRRALPAPDDTALGREAYEAPRGPVEEIVAGIWSELLGLDRIGRHDNFFDLGGHSLLAARLAWETKTSVATVFAAPTIAKLAAAIATEAEPSRPPIISTSRDGLLALSYGQQRMWFLQQLAPASAAYHIALGRRLRGALDVPALRHAIEDVVARQDVLRTTIPAPEGVPHQHVVDSVPTLAIHDLSVRSGPRVGASPPLSISGSRVGASPPLSISGVDRASELARIVRDQTERPFDLATEPPLRATLVRTAPDEHVLYLTLHHIAADGWSVGILWIELATAYAAYVAGRAPALAPLPIRYADYAAWQRVWFSGDVLDRQLDYWKRQLAAAPDETTLPIKGPRPPAQTYGGAVHVTRIDREVVEALRALGRTHGGTLFITLLAAFRAALFRHSGQEDICIGVPHANRTMPETERLVGLFVNTLVLRTPAAARMPFSDLLAAERATALAAYAHADAPFEMVVETLGVTRSLSRNPVFQVMFQVQFDDAHDAQDNFVGLETESVTRERVSTHLDLDVSVLVDRDGAELAFVYNVDLFDDATIADFARHFEAVLSAVIAEPATPLADLAILTSAERDRLVRAWNDTQRATPDRTLPGFVAERAAATPDAIAVEASDGSLTYRELVARSHRLARRLLAAGLAREERVALCLPRGVDVVVAMLAVLEAGGAYLPLDLELPADRLAFMVGDAGVRIAITTVALRDRVTTDRAIVLDEPAPVHLGEEAADAPGIALHPDQLAYVLYTSGSTGRPKAVHVRHGGLVNFLTAMLDAPGMTARDTLLAITTTSFDISGLELFLPLVAGARVVVASSDAARDGAQIKSLLETSGATMMQATPAAWRMVLDAGWRGAAGFVALCGGEALPPDLAAALRPLVGALWNLYGPTETTIWSARKRIEPALPIRLGSPIANTALYVLDPTSFEPQPFDVPGELFIAGDGLARGYGRAILTAERFLPDPHAAVPGARMYRTGDLVRRHHDGELEFLGRVDHQVKLRGFRIELGEIEAVLGDHSSVAEVVAVMRDDALVAYVVPLGSVTAASLLDAARERLPDYMIPSAIVFLDELPLSPSGKIDRRALPAPAWQSTSEYVAPRTEIEVALVAIWERVLARPRIGIRDNFFELGGHSLLAIRLVWEINQAFAATIALRQIFSAPTIERFSALPELVARNGDRSGVAIEATGKTSVPATIMQVANHDIHRDDPTNPFVHLALGLELVGSLDRDALHRALTELIRRHASLRTTYRDVEGRLYQDIAPAAPFPLATVDLSDAADQDAALRACLVESRGRPFDLVTSPVRGTLAILAPDRHVLGLVIHHVSGDGPSLQFIIDELVLLYRAELGPGSGSESRPLHLGPGRAPPPAPVLQFIDFADFVLRHDESPRGRAERAYWADRLAGAPSVEVPFVRDRAAVDRRRDAVPRGIACFAMHFTSSSVPAHVRDGLVRISRATDSTMMMVMLAAFASTLHSLTGQTDICIQSPLSHRHRQPFERTIGAVVNPLIMRLDLAGHPNFLTAVQRTQNVVLSAYDHGLSPVIDWASHRLRRINFNFNQGGLDDAGVESIAPGLSVSRVSIPLEHVKTPFDVHMWLFDRSDGIAVYMLGNKELFEPAECERLLARYLEQLARVSEDPTIAIAYP